MRSIYKTNKLIFILILFFTLFSSELLSWNARGHMIISSIAYERLDQDVKTRLIELIYSHEDIDIWKKEVPVDSDSLVYFLHQLSIWPDVVRRSGHPHDHPPWHYITYELYPDGRKITDRIYPDDDVVYGINYSSNLLSSEEPDSLKAIYLGWLVHLTADIHQPMHTATLFSDDFPEGDRDEE